MSLLINSLDHKQVLNSYNFARLADVVFSEVVTKRQYLDLNNSSNSEIIEENESTVFYAIKNFNLKENDIIFTNSYLVKPLFKRLYSSNFKNIKIITTQTDHPIGKQIYSLKPDCVSEWYSTNVNYSHNALKPIPLGLANYYSPKNLFKDNYSKFTGEVEKVNKLYLNFEVNTNYFHRNKLKNKLKNKDFVISDNINSNIETYLEKLSKYEFILCPWGNGLDTHRIWETIYAGSIPIIPRHSLFIAIFGNDDFLFDSVADIEKKMDNTNSYKSIVKNNKILNMDYWSKKINEIIYDKPKIKNEYIEVDLQDVNLNYSKLKFDEQKHKRKETIKRKVHNKVLNF